MTTSNDDIIYYSSIFANGETNISLPIQYTDLRNDTIISDPSRYYMTCIYFSVDTSNIPIFNFATNNNGSPNNNYYTITLIDASGIPFTEGIVFQSYDNNSNIPAPNNVWSIQSFIDMVNTAINTAYTTNNPIYVFNKGGTVNPPFFVYDSISKLIKLYWDVFPGTLFSNPYSNGSIQLYMNEDLYLFFSNFRNIIYNSSNISDPNLFARFNFGCYGDNSFTTALGQFPIICPQNGNQIILSGNNQQEYASVAGWNELTKIVVTSQYLPIQAEYTSSAFDTSISTNSQLNIISELVPPNDLAATNNILIFNPIGQFRYINLIGNTNITKIDFNCYWIDKYNNLRPILLSPSQSFSIKIMFIKKSYIEKVGINKINKLIKKNL
jgi:hypothetical protein